MKQPESIGKPVPIEDKNDTKELPPVSDVTEVDTPVKEYTDGLTEGRIVHYVFRDGSDRPAIVVKVWDKKSGNVALQVFTLGNWDSVDSGLIQVNSVDPSESKSIGSWHWIEKA